MNNKLIEVQHTVDVLVIGSGGAGLTAALEASFNGASVCVLSKTYPTHSQTCQAQGGINAAINQNKSSIQLHINDTIKGAHHLCDNNAIRVMCEEAPNTIKWLDDLGVPFSRDENGQIAQRKFGAASEIRTCFSSDYTGLKILHTLYDQCIHNDIEFLNEHILLSIIKKENMAIGVTALELETGKIKEIYAKTIIMATGGYGNLYNKFTTNSHSTTGDGIVIAYEAGCELSNMEMIQFHPTAMVGNNILISESARGEGGYLIDSEGERFIDELKPRDVVARAIKKKLDNSNKVYLDLRHIEKEQLFTFMPQEYRLAKEFYGIELDKDLLEINPAAHYCMGGIKTNVSCETKVKNLYAVGECAQVGIHGGNRLGGNSLQEIITFGRIAGRNAATTAKKTAQIIEENTTFSKEENNKLENYLKEESEHNFYERKKELGECFFKNVGLFRSETSLNEAKLFVNRIKNETYSVKDKSKLYNKNLVEFIEFKHLMILAQIVVDCALERKESKGAHYRIDYPDENPEQALELIVEKIDGMPNLRCEVLE